VPEVIVPAQLEAMGAVGASSTAVEMEAVLVG